MDICLAIFVNERDYRPDYRRAVIERVCITFLLNASIAALREFFLSHIKEIMSIIEAKQAKVGFCCWALNIEYDETDSNDNAMPSKL